MSCPNEMRLDWVFGKGSESCWFAFSKSSHIWNIGQKVAHILQNLPQEEIKTTGKLIKDSSCSKLDKRDIFIDCQSHDRRLFFQDETRNSLNSLSMTVKIDSNESAT
jgi:hypothetical protein